MGIILARAIFERRVYLPFYYLVLSKRRKKVFYSHLKNIFSNNKKKNLNKYKSAKFFFFWLAGLSQGLGSGQCSTSLVALAAPISKQDYPKKKKKNDNQSLWYKCFRQIKIILFFLMISCVCTYCKYHRHRNHTGFKVYL